MSAKYNQNKVKLGDEREITDEDREFMKKMVKRMPKLSPRNLTGGMGGGSQAQLKGGYLLGLQKDKGDSRE